MLQEDSSNPRTQVRRMDLRLNYQPANSYWNHEEIKGSTEDPATYGHIQEEPRKIKFTKKQVIQVNSMRKFQRIEKSLTLTYLCNFNKHLLQAKTPSTGWGWWGGDCLPPPSRKFQFQAQSITKCPSVLFSHWLGKSLLFSYWPHIIGWKFGNPN